MLEAAFDLLADETDEDPAHYSDPRAAARSLVKKLGYWTESSPPQARGLGFHSTRSLIYDFVTLN
eukprot:3214446-Pyramimonas_sp.AAC.1